MKKNLLSYLRTLLLAGAVSVGCAAAHAAETVGVIVVKADGSTYELELSAVDRIAFGTSGVAVVNTGGQSTEFVYADIDRIMLGKELTGISEISSGGDIAVWPSVVRNIINIAGAEPGTEVRVYSLDGALVAAGRCSDAALSLDLSSAPAGMCLVAVGNQTVKIIKK